MSEDAFVGKHDFGPELGQELFSKYVIELTSDGANKALSDAKILSYQPNCCAYQLAKAATFGSKSGWNLPARASGQFIPIC